MRPANWARIQSSLKRLATNSVTLEKSSATWAVSGLIQVLNCCWGSSWASCSMQACHRLSPAPSAALVCKLLCCPSLIVLVACGYSAFRKTVDSNLSKPYPQRRFDDQAQRYAELARNDWVKLIVFS